MQRKPFAAGVRWKNGAWRYRVPRWVDDATLCRVCDGKREVTLGRTDGDAVEEWMRIQRSLGTVQAGETARESAEELSRASRLDASQVIDLPSPDSQCGTISHAMRRHSPLA